MRLIKKLGLGLAALAITAAVFTGCLYNGDYLYEQDSFTEAAVSSIGEESASETEAAEEKISEDGEYSAPDLVAEYIRRYDKLPGNFVTKKEAESAGWIASEGNLWDVLPGKSIGGDRFGNREGLLPSADGRTWRECDVNYNGGFRGAERILYSSDGLIFYTNDHYESFTEVE